MYLGKIEYNKVYIVIKYIIIEYMNVIWSLMCKNDLIVILMIWKFFLSGFCMIRNNKKKNEMLKYVFMEFEYS